MRYASITGWGKCLPPSVLSNHDLEALMDTSDEWITARTGIKERRVSHVNTSDLAALAGKRAIAAAGLEPGAVDLVVVATCTPDTVLPSTASVVQEKIGATGAGAMDQNAVCSGFLYGLVSASAMVQAGASEAALVIGAERLTYLLDFTDRSTAVLFGDGAGAVVVEPTDEPGGIVASELGSDGSLSDILWVEGSGTATSRTDRERNHKMQSIKMNGPEVFKHAVRTMGDASARVMEKAGWDLNEVDLFIAHQANERIIDATARRLQIDPSKVFVNIASYGNTSAATIPIALTEAIEFGRVSPRARIMFAAFGSGLSWGSVGYQFGSRVHALGELDEELPPTERSTMDLLADNFSYFGGGPPA